MNTLTTSMAMCSAQLEPKLHPNMTEALQALRDELELLQPEALPLFEMFEPWVYATHCRPGVLIDGGQLRHRFLMFPFTRMEELLKHAIASTRVKGGTVAQRTSGLREVAADLRQLLSAFAQRDGRWVGRFVLKTLGLVLAGIALLLAPTFFFDVGTQLRSWISW